MTLTCLILTSSFTARGSVTVQASPEFPWPTITLHATETRNPYWGRYGGYHDIWYAIKTELAKIGINLELELPDDFTWWEKCWEKGQWNKSWDEGGWDMTMSEWWLQPHAIEPWFSSMVLSSLQPDEGFNIHPWNNSKADELLTKAMSSFDAETRQYYLWKWQEVFMHDPPWINIYYPRVYEVMGAWVDGYDPTGCWWYDVSNLTINPAKMPAERKNLRQDWVYYAVSEEVWQLLPLFTKTRTEEQMCTLQWRTLYKWSLNWANYVAGTEPDPTDYLIVPDLALTDPWPVDGNLTHMRIQLRDNVKWSDYATTGEILDAQDVAFTFNTCILDKKAKNTGIGDVIWLVDHVEEFNNTTVDFILKQQCPDLKSVLANDRGCSIVPYHRLKQYEGDPWMIKADPSNWAYDNPDARLPVTGPFKLKEIVPLDYMLLERNPLYFGYDLGWGPDPSVQAVYLKWVIEPALRMLEFQTYRLDMGDYATAPIEAWEALATDPNLNVFQYDRPASNPILLNFNNPYLSNRYIRLAIAHAVPYERIVSEILPSWGVEGYFGKTLITPIHYYTDPDNVTVHLFNEELEPYHYDIEEALDYMEMWWYSTNQPYTDGPVGDSDLSGLVNLDDFLVWRAKTETDPSITWPQEVVPGNIIDPDFNNDDVTLADYEAWLPKYGEQYPFPGAR